MVKSVAFGTRHSSLLVAFSFACTNSAPKFKLNAPSSGGRDLQSAEWSLRSLFSWKEDKFEKISS